MNPGITTTEPKKRADKKGTHFEEPSRWSTTKVLYAYSAKFPLKSRMKN